MRLQPDGRVQVIEVNPNPWLSSRAEFAMAARKSGRTYPGLVEEIVELAMARAPDGRPRQLKSIAVRLPDDKASCVVPSHP